MRQLIKIPIILKQRATELANRRQQQYVTELRAGNVGLATALDKPQTTQSYKGESTVNIKAFMKERGYADTDKIPDSIFSTPEKLSSARQQASRGGTQEMGDLMKTVPVRMSPAGGDVIAQRKFAQERIHQFDPIIPQNINEYKQLAGGKNHYRGCTRKNNRLFKRG
jgi:hypothetical protein